MFVSTEMNCSIKLDRVQPRKFEIPQWARVVACAFEDLKGTSVRRGRVVTDHTNLD
jgi:hypothetical protein